MSTNFYNDKDSLKDSPEFSSSAISSNRLEDALNYHAQGFNVIPIPKPRQQNNAVSNNDYEISSENADGKSAKGYGSWRELQSRPQTLEDVKQRFQNKKD
jgi:hypothetical protein